MDDDAALSAVKKSFLEQSIPWSCVEHEPVLTVDAGLKAVGSSGGSFAKNLFVKDKKAGLFLLTAAADCAIDLKKLPSLLGIANASFRFADGAVLEEKLGVKQGAVTPLAVMNDLACEVTLVLDQSLLGATKVRTENQTLLTQRTMPIRLTSLSSAPSLAISLDLRCSRSSFLHCPSTRWVSIPCATTARSYSRPRISSPL